MATITVKDAGASNVVVNTLPIGAANTGNSLPISFATDITPLVVNSMPSAITTSNGTSSKVSITDPASGVSALVQAFHNADNQSINSTSYGLMTGGVDQLVNASGNLDRKRGVSGDGMPVTGLAAEVPMIFNGTSYDRLRSVQGDGVSNTGLVQEALAIWNGTTYDRASGNTLYGMKTYTVVNGGPVTNANPVPTLISSNGAVVSNTNPLPTFISVSNSAISNTNPVPTMLSIGGSLISNTNPVPFFDAFQAPVATSWTTATSVNTAQTVNTSGYDTVIVTLVASSSTTGGVVIFEVYDGATWLPVKAPTIVDYTTVGSVTLTASYSKGFQVPVAGFPQFRARLASVITGTSATLTITTIVSSAPDVSLVTVGLDPAQSLPAGNNILGKTGIDQTTSGVTNGIAPAAVNIATGQVSINSTATAIVSARTGRNTVTLINLGTVDVYVGNSSVTTNTGLLCIGVKGGGVEINGGAALYGITANGTSQTISYAEAY